MVAKRLEQKDLTIKQRRELTVEKLHPKVILTFCFLFECTLFPRKRGCSRLKKGRHQRQRQVRLKTCSTGGVRQDVRGYMYADVHCRGFG